MIATNIELTAAAPHVSAPPPKTESKHVIEAQPLDLQKPLSGPSQGPTAPPPPTEEDLVQDDTQELSYAETRALIQNLTLPTVPNFSIPPSPPGSPPQKATNKFAQFLELKKKAQHFNQRLEGSSVLRDPSHLQRLLDFAGIIEADSYASTLPEDVAVPTEFPEWAYVEELRASQKKIAKTREQEKSKGPREAVEFVSATKSGTSSGTGTPSGKGLRQSASERVMAGMDREKSSHSSGKRKELEHRSRDNSSRRRSRSRSPKRRRD